MRLKSMELCGFKSFPDRTLLRFDRGVTVVVGPNGSGKSNLSDAIRWVLGETSAKNVRGTKMEDVIFGGTDTRRALGFAEVTITFDNTGDERLEAIPEDELTVTRRCNRNGDSDYRINGKSVRQRDITELFLNTGVGRQGYSIIGQGRVAEILSHRSEDRRAIFEEAAGISRFRYQKTDAEKRLAETDSNLTRIHDILGELSGRVSSLERDAAKAKEYLELYEQKKKIDIAVWLFDTETIRRRVQDTGAALKQAEQALASAETALAALEKENEETFEQSQSNRRELDSTGHQLQQAYERHVNAQSNIRLAKAQLQQLKERMLLLTQQEAEHRISLEKAKQDAAACQKNLADQKQQLDALHQSLAEQESTYETLCRQRNETERKKEECRQHLQETDASITDCRLRLSTMDGSRQSPDSRRSGLAAEQQQQKQHLDLLRKRIAQAEQTIQTYESKDAEMKRHLESIMQNFKVQEEQENELREEQSRISLDLSAKKQRADTLRRMEEHFEGYNASIRFVMEAAALGKLRGICGPISRLMEVKSRYTLAIETAMGAGMQNIVVEDEEAAKSAILQLKKANAGRATFCPITSVRGQAAISSETFRRYDGFLGIASELVQCDKRYREIISAQLGRTAVFDTLDHAMVMAKSTGYRTRAVTLDGQQINTGGSFTGGSARRDSGMLTRSAEIAKLDAEAARLDALFQSKTEERNALRRELQKHQSTMEEATAQQKLLRTVMQAEKTQLEVLRSQQSGDEARLNQLSEELAGITQQAEQDAHVRQTLEQALKDLDSQKAQQLIQQETLQNQHAKENREAQKQAEQITALRIRIAAAQRDVASAEQSQESAGTALQNILAAQQRDKENLDSTLRRQAEEEENLEALQQEEESAAKQQEELTAARQKLSENNTRWDRVLASLRDKIKEATHTRESQYLAYTKLDAQHTRALEDQDKTAAKLWEDYELTYTAASELGIKPVTAESRGDFVNLQSGLRTKIRALGNVNVASIEEYQNEKQRLDSMQTQYDDLTGARSELTGILEKLERDMKEQFLLSMEKLNHSFQHVFRELFGGGSAELRLTDPENALECGIEINAAPPGKIIKSLSLLSGGEQSFVAIALFFAILSSNPAPFAILDEIEAALDDINIVRFADYVRRYTEKTQFIIISHRRGTMEAADTIYGVTMPERGISRVLTLHVNEVEARLGVKIV